ncbi:MAG: hypothetical protein ACK5LK_09105 [Chthoniobacterales bacterium]
MSATVSPLRRSLLSFTNTFEPRPVTIIYVIGVIVWAAATFILGYKTGEEQISYAVFEAFGSAWQDAFLWGLAAVAIASIVYCIIQKKNFLAVLINSLIYVSPFALFLLGTWTLDLFYDRHFATVETTRLFGPIFMLFYLIGILYMTWRLPKGREEVLPAFMLPTMTVALLILGLTAFRVFTSTDYVYRDAFMVTVDNISKSGDTTLVDGVLTIKKAGAYLFTVVGNEMELSFEEASNLPSIKWTGEVTKPSAEGDYPFHMVIPKSAGTVTIEEPTEENYMYLPPHGPRAYLQVNLAEQDGKPTTFVKSLPIWLEEY